MDVLHFLKEEYTAIKAETMGQTPGELAEVLTGSALSSFMSRVELIVRVGVELIVPELTDSGHDLRNETLLAEDHSRSLSRAVHSFRKTEMVPEGRRADLFLKVFAYIDQMERVVLPLVRERIPTAVREDIGEIAVDYRLEAQKMVRQVTRVVEKTTISA